MTSTATNVRSTPTTPFSQLDADMKLQQEIAAATTTDSKSKRSLKIPNDVPDVLYGMLSTTAMQADAGNIPPEREEKARKDVGWAWANWNANRSDKRYQALIEIAVMFPKGDAIPPVMVHPSYRPETVSESAIRLLRLVQRTWPSRFPFLLTNAVRLEMIGSNDAARL